MKLCLSKTSEVICSDLVKSFIKYSRSLFATFKSGVVKFTSKFHEKDHKSKLELPIELKIPSTTTVLECKAWGFPLISFWYS